MVKLEKGLVKLEIDRMVQRKSFEQNPNRNGFKSLKRFKKEVSTGGF